MARVEKRAVLEEGDGVGGCVEGGREGGGGLVGVGLGKDMEEGGGEVVVLGGREVGGKDVARAAVYDEAGADGAGGGGWRGVFHFGHCGGGEVDTGSKEEMRLLDGYAMKMR